MLNLRFYSYYGPQFGSVPENSKIEDVCCILKEQSSIIFKKMNVVDLIKHVYKAVLIIYKLISLTIFLRIY